LSTAFDRGGASYVLIEDTSLYAINSALALSDPQDDPTGLAKLMGKQDNTTFEATSPVDTYARYLEGEYIKIDLGANYSFTGDFTIEFWMYILSIPTNSGPLSFFPSLNGSFVAGEWDFQLTAAGFLFQYATSTTTTSPVQASNIGALSTNTWYHVAVVRIGSAANNLKIYINGALGSSGASSGTTTIGNSAAAGRIGARAQSPAANFFNGYISCILCKQVILEFFRVLMRHSGGRLTTLSLQRLFRCLSFLFAAYSSKNSLDLKPILCKLFSKIVLSITEDCKPPISVINFFTFSTFRVCGRFFFLSKIKKKNIMIFAYVHF
jgi:hypothetical protein